MKLRKIAIVLSIVLLSSIFAPMTTAISYAEGNTGGFIAQLFEALKNIAKPTKPSDKPDQPSKPSDKPDQPGKPSDKPDKPTKPSDKPDQPGKPSDKPDKPDKPDQKEVDRIVKDTVKKLEVLKSGCQSTLINVAFKFAISNSAHEKTVLYKQGKEEFAGCVASFNAIMAEAGGKLNAIGADVSSLEPLQQAFNRIIAEGEAILDRIVN
ncbi:hypothetical protein PAECIP111893_02640 [Paenibacillus plantiphilus]|uniref:Uncharacterized protein n=1 Tax=Paenibacillus plantiphilus TaxID=2905650 RepID=A0ABM9C871_9BACL|nr:hypothetical protein [Paenibacillus plantiphilus]CAH1206886.1 hypothetical protein PAECIP111893_02640 [Paenibacillus plantiphilus]